jgi:hypothetical protein
MNPEGDLCNKVLTMSLLAPGVVSSDDGQWLLISVARCWAACWQEAVAARGVWAGAIVMTNAMAARAIVDEADIAVACPGLSQGQPKAFILARRGTGPGRAPVKHAAGSISPLRQPAWLRPGNQ